MSSTARRRKLPEDRLDALFHALSDRTRRALVTRLVQGPAMITELAKPFAMSLPAVSRHIRVLEDSGLVAREVDGRVHRCSLNAAPLESIQDWLRHYRHFWQHNLEALARHVEKP